MKQTPKTDAKVNPSYCECDPGTVVNVRFARELEQEVAKRDVEIERLKGLLADIRDMPEIDQDDAHRLRHKAQNALGTTKPEPAKPETFPAHGETWTRHNPGDPMPVDGGREIYGLDTFGSTGPFPAQSYDWSTERKTRLGVNLIGYRLADEAKPDPYAHLREAEKAGKEMQRNYGTREIPIWKSVRDLTYDQPPEFYRVKPWNLPPPPEGEQWHRVDGWTEEMLPEGWRPLLLGEMDALDDQEFVDGGWVKVLRAYREPTSNYDQHTRTRRPLPEPEVWVDLGPEDCPPGSVLRAIDSKNQGWLSIQAAYTDGVRYTGYTESKETYFRAYSQLATTHQINRSLSTGKWDPNAWEPCRKLFK